MARRNEEKKEFDPRSFAQALRQYVLLGERLYGLESGPERAGERDRKQARRRATYFRRVIEDRHPEVRMIHADTYRMGQLSRAATVARVYISYGSTGENGRLTYPDGSRRQNATLLFADFAGLRGIISKLVYDGKIDPQTTQVVTERSALPVSSFLATLL